MTPGRDTHDDIWYQQLCASQLAHHLNETHKPVLTIDILDAMAAHGIAFREGSDASLAYIDELGRQT